MFDEPFMQRRAIPLVLYAAIVLLGSGPSSAAEKAKAAAAPPASQAQASAPTAPVKPVDINSASRAELKTLPGIGDAEATRIIAARPYPSKAKLVADKVLSVEAYDALKGRIIAIQPEPPTVKTEGKVGGNAKATAKP